MRPKLIRSASLCATLSAGVFFAASSLVEAQTTHHDEGQTRAARVDRGKRDEGHADGTGRGVVSPSPTPEPTAAARATPTPQPSPAPSPGKNLSEDFEPPATEGDSAPLSAAPELILAPGEIVDDAPSGELHRGFHWKSATRQSLLFLAVQHGYALTQPKTRRDFKGPFFRDYFRSVGSLSKWEDGGRFFTNYVAHPMQGSLLGFVYVQNDPQGQTARFGRSGTYWRSRLKALAWSAAWSTQFEIGPVSQASIGNVGLHGKQTWVDIVITPTGGFAWLVAEDALDRFVVRHVERKTDSLLLKIAARMLLNPTRSSANLLRFKKPWHRDRQ
ncbi:MAG: hypothetical protein LC802_18920 [Acidobacteria bacterium]|nr:hypothetical protein [Acidobacteriota bacterium]